MASVPEAREHQVSEEHQETAQPGEETEREVDVLHVFEVVAELRTIFVEGRVLQDVVFEVNARN